MKKMNILYITNHLNIGGISSYLFSLASGLKSRGHNICVATSGGDLLSRFQQEGIGYIHIPIKTKNEFSPKIIFSIFKLSGLIRQNNIDLVHSNSRTTQVLGSLLVKGRRIPHIFSCHGFFKRRILRRLFPCWGEAIVAISDSVKEHLISDFGLSKDKIRVINSGIKIGPSAITNEITKAQRKRELGLGERLVVGIVARLSDVKGHQYLIEAMKIVFKEFPQAMLVIAGDGKLKNELANLVKRLGIEERVVFLPATEDPQALLPAMDIFVLPSLKEGLGLALMEAMACGLAVIGSSVGGIKSLIQHGYNGLLVAPTDVDGLSCAILDLLRDKPKRDSLGQRARILIENNFSQEKMVLETEKLYLECLNRKDSSLSLA